ncbi:MAG: exodeoxyribonuclease VII small subunit [Alphaproteobacteria bacterium]|nr:exodeoxyribonuclease VII small subunit [Alphaproteobacteria bacterium]
MNNSNLTYSQAYTALQNIVNKIEKGDIEIDELSTEIKNAMQLFEICQAKLTSTELDIQEIMNQIQDLKR